MTKQVTDPDYTWRILFAYFWLVLMMLCSIGNVVFTLVSALTGDWWGAVWQGVFAACSLLSWRWAEEYRDRVEEIYG